MIALRRLYMICLLTGWLFPPTVSAQQTPDQAINSPSDDSVRAGFFRTSGPDLRLYTGKEYIPNGQRARGTAFFQTGEPLAGSLFYNDAWYTRIPLQYDLVADAVIIDNFTGNGKIELVKDKLRYFRLGGYTFIYLAPPHYPIRAGYYAQLYSGHGLSVFARYEKKLFLPSGLEDQARYNDYHYYYVEKDGMFDEVGSKGALLDLFRDKKEQLKKYIRANRIDFRKDWEGALVKTAAYYADLKK